MTEELADLLPLLTARRDSSSVIIGMGGAGLATRILASRFGSRWTYAGDAVAPGQITAARLLQEFRFRRIRPDTAVYGVVGHPVTHSLSPAMHNAGFAALGLDAAYVPFDVTRLDGLKDLARAIDLRGLSVTIPFKLDVLPLLDVIAPEAHAAGAVNTIAISDGRWVGRNTDADGFLAPLRRRISSLTGVRAAILGAGGAARAAGLALRDAGAIVTVCARRGDAGQVVADAIGARAGEWPPRRGSWDLLVNATPVGSRALPDEIPFGGPFDGTLVYDLVYDPDPTALMQAARAQGCSTLGGLDMLVAQAERQFEIWTGQRPPAGLFSDAAAKAMEFRSSSSVATQS
jgi:3-dehydroquinate dehydratase/shikimate dehydrogenase